MPNTKLAYDNDREFISLPLSVGYKNTCYDTIKYLPKIWQYQTK